MLEPAHRCGTRPGRWRSPVTGKAHRMRMGRRIARSTLRWGKPATWGRTRRKHAARKGHAARTCRTGAVGANLPAGSEQTGFCPARMRVQPRNRMRENCTSGTARGAPGNRRSYRGDCLDSYSSKLKMLRRPCWQNTICIGGSYGGSGLRHNQAEDP